MTEGQVPIPDTSLPAWGGAADQPVVFPQVAGYEVVGWLGGGGMGAVYEAWQQQPRRRVALKVIRSGVVSSAMFRQFELEVSILGRLEHPAIARIYAAGSAEIGGASLPYYAMEYIEGKPITDYVREAGLTIPQTMALWRKVVEGVHFAHQKGVIHRDLKPANILVDAEGQPKILDFGVARLTQSDLHVVTQQHDLGKLVGTLAYMAPEQAMGDASAVDVRADIYALGSLAYEMLVGTCPHQLSGKPITEMIQIISREEPKRLGQINKALAGDPEIIVGHCLEKEKERRYPSAAALADDIERWLDRRPIAARAPSAGYLMLRFAQRHKIAVTAAAAILIALVGGLTVANIGLLRARAAEQEALREREAARANLRKAMDAVDEFMVVMGIHGPLAVIPEAQPVRERLLRNAIDFYQRFLAENEGDRSLQEELAYALRRLLDAPGLLLDDEEAIVQARQRIETLTALLEQDPDDVKYLRDLGRAQSELADRLARVGDDWGAVAALEEAVRLGAEVAAQEPESWEFQREWARTIVNRGVSRRIAGQLILARADLEQGLELRQQLVDRLPDNLLLRRDLARSQEELAKSLADLGEPELARRAFDRARVEFESLIEAAPHESEYLRDLAASLNEWSLMEAAEGEIAVATRAAEMARDVREELADLYGFRADYLRELAYAEDALGSLYQAQQRYADAQAMWQQARRNWQRLVAEHGNQPEYRRGWARHHLEIAKQDYARQQYGAAELAALEAIEIYEVLSSLYPQQTIFRADLARAYEELRRIRVGSGNLRGANEALSEAWRIYEELVFEYGDRAAYQAALARLMAEIGKLRLAGGDAVGAVQAFQDARGRYGRLAEAQPDNVQYRRDLARTLIDVGRAQLSAGELPAAERSLNAGNRLYAELNREFPRRPEYTRERARALDELGKMQASSGSVPLALVAFEDAHDLYEELPAAILATAALQLDLARHHEEWGKALLADGQVELGTEQLQRCLSLFRSLLANDSRNRVNGLNLAYALGNTAIAMQQLDAQTADALFSEAVNVWEQMLEQSPDDPLLLRGRAWAERRVESEEPLEIIPDEIIQTRIEQGGVFEATDRATLLRTVGRHVKVRGEVESVAVTVGRNEWTFINFDESRNGFLAVIHRNNLPPFQERYGTQLQLLNGQTVILTGDLSVFQNRPQVLISRPNQLQLVGELPSVRPAEVVEGQVLSVDDGPAIARVVGQEATVRGVVSKVEEVGQILFVNFVGIPRDQFVVIIGRQNWPAFRYAWGQVLADAWEGETVTVTGFIHRHRGVPQMRITLPEQIRVESPDDQLSPLFR